MTTSFGSGVSLQLPIQEIIINLDGGGSPITSGDLPSYYTASFSGRIVGWYITGYPAGDIVVDVLKRHNGIPTLADTITGAEKPFLSGQQRNSDIDLTSWTDTQVEPDDTFGVSILSVATLTNCVVTLKVLKA